MVVLKSGNEENPDATHENVFAGGTVLLGGKLGLTRGNSIGQGWVGIMGRAKDKAPVLMGQYENYSTTLLPYKQHLNFPIFLYPCRR